MVRNQFFNTSISFLPVNGNRAAQCVGFNTCPAPPRFCSGQIKHRAFAVGFFGFHYIRATLENAPVLRQDSLRRLLQLLNGLHLNEEFMENLHIQEVKSLPEFRERIIKRVSLEIGDAYSPSTQWMVEFGFSLAVTYSMLITTAQYKSAAKTKKYLEYIENNLSHLLSLAKKSEVPKTITDTLQASATVLQKAKTRRSSRKCLEITGLAVSNLLTTKVAVGLLN